MKSKFSLARLGGVAFVSALLFGLTVISAAAVHAQSPYWGNRDRYERNRDRRRYDDRDDYYRNDRYRRNNDYYRRNGGYGYNVYQIAQQNGYQAGLNTGASDAQRRQSYNPRRSHYYKDGDSGYSSSYGSKGQYKQVFRDAFMQGYDQGYRRYGGYYGNDPYYRNGRYGNGTGWGNILGGILGIP
jgi:hypothetical protein